MSDGPDTFAYWPPTALDIHAFRMHDGSVMYIGYRAGPDPHCQLQLLLRLVEQLTGVYEPWMARTLPVGRDGVPAPVVDALADAFAANPSLAIWAINYSPDGVRQLDDVDEPDEDDAPQLVYAIGAD